ncbi:uracil-DNA glycosylase family protein [Ferrimonas pelagia]|uniref:Uracil-DNA glycosylase family protein n=1 Tax=Ferrimonas pelagia TaxID=1177826 RepID=A0ABP9FFJ5_9GAMM
MASFPISPHACRHCQDKLEPNPVTQLDGRARLLIIGQAPGLKVHQTGIPWNDPSGQRLRQWLNMPPETFYDPAHVAILPMGFCYPGRGRHGDNPPDPRCAPLWHGPILNALPNIELTLLIGQYAQRHYLASFSTLTETVQRWQTWAPSQLPLPHPSPRNNLWLRRNPWFERELIPALQRRILAMGLSA